jgi:gliding motility-associated-like protein
MKRIHTLLLFFLCFSAQTQNLVPNSGFENNMAYVTVVPNLECLADWKDYTGTINPGLNTPDLCYNTSVFFPPVSIPAYEGQQFMGIDCQEINPEYIQVRLNAPMVAGQTYCVSFYVSMYDEFTIPAKLGAYFSGTALTLNPFVSGLHSQIETSVIPDPAVWQQVHDTYTATGGEQFMIIGAFENTVNLFAYMYVDLVEVYPFHPVLELGRDTTLCQGASLVLDAGTGGSVYAWSNGEHTASIAITEPGTFWVEKFYGACSVTDTIHIGSAHLDLGIDQVICRGESVVLDAGTNGGVYSWSNGQNTSSIVVTTPGIYWVEKHEGDCVLSDTLEVESVDCTMPPITEGELYVPNAFTPDHDGINDFFGPKVDNITEYSMTVFNRWGQVVFTSQNPGQSWDGMYKQAEAPEGVYVYSITYKTGLRLLDVKGHVSLIR